MKNLKTFALGLLFASASQAAGTPLENAHAFMDGLLAVAKESREKKGQVDSASSARVRELSAKVDFTQLARRSLGTRWGGFPESQRQEFLRVLQQLLENVAYPSAKNFTLENTALEYRAAGDRVTVSGKMKREKDGEIILQTIETTLIFAKSGKVIDAVVEGEVLSESLKRQFNEALKKQTFADLIAKMKSRVEDSKVASPKTSGPKAAAPQGAK